MLRLRSNVRKERIAKVLNMYQMCEKLYERKKRACSMDPDHRGRTSSIMNTFKVYRTSAEGGNDRNFRRFLRLPLEQFNELLAKVAPRLTHAKTHSDPISAETRLVITLRYLAHGLSYAALSGEFLIAAPTISIMVPEVLDAIIHVLEPEYLKFPDKKKWAICAKEYEQLWNFPGVVASIDGKHIEIVAPPKSGSKNFSYKKTYSVVLMALVDANYKFLAVDVGGEGRTSDAGLFKRSNLNKLIETGQLNLPDDLRLPGMPEGDTRVPHIILADEGFAMTREVMRPFKRSDLIEDEQKVYNYRHSRARRCVENGFGILATRWRIFLRPIYAHENTVKLIVYAACCLHNYLRESDSAKQGSERYIPPRYADHYDQDNELVDGMWRAENIQGIVNIPTTRGGARRQGHAPKAIRNRYARFFMSREGAVPWQLPYIRRGGQLEAE